MGSSYGDALLDFDLNLLHPSSNNTVVSLLLGYILVLCVFINLYVDFNLLHIQAHYTLISERLKTFCYYRKIR